MTDREMEEGFIEALATDRYDRATRKIFADFLSERGRDDEAQEQLRMATLEWCESAQRIEEFAAEFCPWSTYGEYYSEGLEGMSPEQQEEYARSRLTFESLIDGAHAWLDRGETTYLNFATPDFAYRGSSMREFWRHFTVVTGRVVPIEEDENESYDEGFFRCSC